MSAARAGKLLARPIELDLLFRPTPDSVGYGALLLLAFMLPFEAAQRPFVHNSALTLTNLSALYLLTVALAALTIWRERRRLVRRTRVVPAILLSLLVIVSCLSALLGSHRSVGLKWVLELVFGATLWLAIPLWVDNERGERLRSIIWVVIAGSMLAALAGLVEVLSGVGIDSSLLAPFKQQPTLIGTYLRLSGTFLYANIAGGYLAMTLPFMAAALLSTAGSDRMRQITVPIGLAVCTAALVLTYSRGALLGAGTGLSVLWLLMRGWRTYRVPSRGLVTLICTIAAAAALSGILMARASSPAVLRLTTQSDLEWYQATYRGHVPRVLRPNARIVISVNVHNTGTLPWVAGGHNPFRLSYHWLLPNGHLDARESIRTRLPHDVMPGTAVRLRAMVSAPLRRGQYRFVWDMVQEHVLWFALRTGGADSSAVIIRGRAAAHFRTARPAQEPLPILPAAPPQPERSALWSTALRMIEAHPLLGVGPDAYRLSYGDYSSPRERHWDTRIYANSLALELAADIGVLGAVLFLAFLAAVAWPLLKCSIHGAPAWWEASLLASLVVVLAHGTVDYLLGSRSVSYLLWILLGLIAASTLRPSPTVPRELPQ